MAIERDGKKLYAIEYYQERTATLWVLADNLDDACADADELVPNERDWDEVNDGNTVAEAMVAPQPGEMIWSGGEAGRDIPW